MILVDTDVISALAKVDSLPLLFTFVVYIVQKVQRLDQQL